MPAENAPHRFSHIGIRVHRINDLHTRQVGDFPNGRAELLEAVTEAFATVSRDYDQLTSGLQLGPGAALDFIPLQPVAYIKDCVDARITGDRNAAVIHSFSP